jgi:hypothetical protein
MSESKRVSINKIDYEVIKFYYIDGKYNGDDYFSLLDECSKENSKIKCGEIYILIPGWVEMQDLYQKSSEQDIQTKKYVINLQKLRMNKIKLFCIKIVDNESKSHFINDELINNMYPSLGNFILRCIDDVISVYYMGSGMSSEMEKQLAYDCYRYYSAIEKKRHGKDVIIPPCPGVVMMLNICQMFDCTPDIARNISKKDIDMILIAKEQENLCKNNPDIIGF